MNYWLMKSEPDVFGIEHLMKMPKKTEHWDGVRNYQARNFMRDMAVGDRGFFYHSRNGLEIVGIMEIVAEAHPDSTAADPKWVCVDVRAERPLPRPVTLDELLEILAQSGTALRKLVSHWPNWSMAALMAHWGMVEKAAAA